MTGPSDPQKGPTEPGFINGGIGEVMPGIFMSPIIVMDVPNIDEAVAKVEAAGGSVVSPKQPISDMGLYARVKDSEGNTVGLWQNLK